MIAEHLAAFARASERTFEADRGQTVGGSEIGQCARKVFFSKNEDDAQIGSDRDEDYADRWGAKIRGSFFENCFWEPAMRAAYGDRLLFAGADQRTFSDGYLSATSDGLILDLPPDALHGVPGAEGFNGGCVVVDCKTADPRTNLAKPKDEHVYQIHVQLGLIRARTNYRPEYGILSYTDASFWDEGREFAIRYDPGVYEEAQRRATLIMTAKSASELKPEGYIAGAKECGYCAFKVACGVLRADSVPKQEVPINGGTLGEAKLLALGIQLATKQAEAAEKDASELRQKMKELLTKAGTRKIPGVVSWSAMKGRPSWDMKALRAAAEALGLDLSQYETVGEPTDRLVITLRDRPLGQERKADAEAHPN